MDRWSYEIIDVFTDYPLAGNQLAVFRDAAGIPETLLQPLAKEIGFAETVYIYPANAGGDARMRIFTPASEIPFAGHPVIGTAIALTQGTGRNQIVLETGRGPIPVRVQSYPDRASRATMDQPIPTITPYPDEQRLMRH